MLFRSEQLFYFDFAKHIKISAQYLDCAPVEGSVVNLFIFIKRHFKKEGLKIILHNLVLTISYFYLSIAECYSKSMT